MEILAYIDCDNGYLIPENETGEPQPSTSLGSRTLVATFGLIVEEVWTSELLPPGVPTGYTRLCDYLEEYIQGYLQDGTDDLQYPEASKKDGGILSVRVAFQWHQQNGQPVFDDPGWWSLLELAAFEEIYPGQDAARFWDQVYGE